MDNVLIWKGCGTCKEAKRNGMCKDNKCISVTSKTGNKIAKDLKVKSVPQCFTTSKDGKPKKCNTVKILNKYLKK